MSALLELENVSVRFGGLTAVADATLSFTLGEVHALIGPNGAGKSTIINCISGFQRRSSGEIRLGGEALPHLDAAAVARRGIARSFQTPQLFSRLSVIDNVRVAHQRQRRARLRVDDLLELVGLTDVAHHQADNLAYGQQRLLEVARALASSPRLLLLDEPAAGLSSEDTERLSRLLKLIVTQFGVAVMIVEHNVPLVRRIADRISVMHHGLVIAAGVPDDVLNDPAVIAAYLGGGNPSTEH
ncbi:ABC transporter ATP-binding protein [Nitrobacteraceae bacterium UC4446_H13]|jgi:branched-chain amino acid transport system ATP-binding protein